MLYLGAQDLPAALPGQRIFRQGAGHRRLRACADQVPPAVRGNHSPDAAGGQRHHPAHGGGGGGRQSGAAAARLSGLRRHDPQDHPGGQRHHPRHRRHDGPGRNRHLSRQRLS